MNKAFRKTLKKLFENPYTAEFRLDAACALACKMINAASASILIFSGTEETLRCSGCYIDEMIGKTDIKGNQYLSIEDSISRGEFFDVVKTDEGWTTWYEKLKKEYRRGSFHLGINSETVTGEWFKKLYIKKNKIPFDILIKSIDDVNLEKEYSCLKNPKGKPGLNLEAKYYVALPICVGGKFFGILRFLFPEKNRFIKDNNGDLEIEYPAKEILEDITDYLSLHLGINYFMTHQKEIDSHEDYPDVKKKDESKTENLLKSLRYIIEQVKAPIESVVGNAEDIIKRDSPKERIHKKLIHIVNLSKVSLEYATNFKMCLEFDSQQIHPRREKLHDLREYLINIAMEYLSLIRTKCIHIRVTNQTPSNIDINVDKGLFRRAIAIMVDNAVKYSFSPEERKQFRLQAKPSSPEDKVNVLITAHEKNDSVVITISSFGLEILEHEKGKIFDQEFRGVKARERYPVGTGIGLYIAKKIIELHNGELELVPQAYKYNTVFRITLPKYGEHR